MMYIHWGTGDSGKGHHDMYGEINNKTSINNNFPNVIRKVTYNFIHREPKWTESITKEILYHTQKQYPDELLQTKISQHKIETGNDFNISQPGTKHGATDIGESIGQVGRLSYFSPSRYITKHNDNKDTIPSGSSRKIRRNISQYDIKKYTRREYIDSLIYYRILAEYSEDICDPIGYKLTNDNAEEIFDGVDHIWSKFASESSMDIPESDNPCLLSQLKRKECPENVIRILQSAVNIVPYKTNLLDSVISKLDLFSEPYPYDTHRYNFIGEDTIHDTITNEHIKKGTLYEMYQNNKRFIWHFLDSYQMHLNDIISTLRSNNIPYQMFNLDEDNYTDVYKGWDIELPKEHTHHKNRWKGYEENYKKVEMMAKEYLSRRNKLFQTSIKKEPTYRIV